jgi:hypothetical protein
MPDNDLRPETAVAAPITIPNTFHFVFGLKEQTEPFHLIYYLCLASCIEINKPDAIYFHYHHEPYGEWWERIRPQLNLRRVEPDRTVAGHRYETEFLAQFRYAHLADFTRLEVLIREGGIYADIDTLFLRPIPQHWRARQFILGEETPPPEAASSGSLCNAWIASAPGAAFGRIWLDEMHKAFGGSWSNHSTVLPQRLRLRHPALIDVVPESAFYSLDWTADGIEALLERSVALPQQAYSLHLWHHNWGSAARRDFSSFHDGLLTPDYVAFADTTYANHARRFLPADVKVSRSKYESQRLSLTSADTSGGASHD